MLAALLAGSGAAGADGIDAEPVLLFGEFGAAFAGVALAAAAAGAPRAGGRRCSGMECAVAARAGAIADDGGAVCVARGRLAPDLCGSGFDIGEILSCSFRGGAGSRFVACRTCVLGLREQ